MKSSKSLSYVAVNVTIYSQKYKTVNYNMKAGICLQIS